MDKKQVPLAPVHDRLTSYMEEKSMRKTPERYEILRVAELANGIFTIDGLMQLMKEHGKFQVSRATIFNTMELFCDAGLVIKHPLATAAHYEHSETCSAKPSCPLFCHRGQTAIHAWDLQKMPSQEQARGQKKQVKEIRKSDSKKYDKRKGRCSSGHCFR